MQKFAVTLIITAQIFAQTDSVSFDWIREYGSESMPSLDILYASISDNSGFCYATGQSNQDYATVKYHPDGNILWESRFDGATHSSDWGSSITVDHQGNVIVTGWSSGEDDYSIVTIKYDSVGTQLWIQHYGSALEEEFTWGKNVLSVDPWGNIYVVGITTGDIELIKYGPDGTIAWTSSYSGTFNGDLLIAIDSTGNVHLSARSDFDIVTMKYDPDGTQLWVIAYDNSNSDNPTDLEVDDVGNVYITGRSFGIDGTPDPVTVKYNSDGNEQWVARYTVGNHWDKAVALAVNTFGEVFITGGGNSNTFTIKYSPTGEQEWINTSSVPDDPKDIIIDLQGNIIVTGESLGNNAIDLLTIMYNPTGEPMWSRRYENSLTYYNTAIGLHIDDNDNLFVSGTSADDYIIIKYDSNGTEQWVTRYDGPPYIHERLSSMIIDSNDNIIMTGSSRSLSGTIFQSIKYTPNGDLEWDVQNDFEESDDDEPCCSGVDSDGNIYVTGTYYDLLGLRNIAIVKYGTDGTLLWTTHIYTPNFSMDNVADMVVDDDGNVFISGVIDGLSTTRAFCAKYNTEGQQEWFSQPDESLDNDSDPVELTVDMDGYVYVTAASLDGIVTIKYNQEGTELWSEVYSIGGESFCTPSDIDTDEAGNPIVVGECYLGGGVSEIQTIKYSPEGSIEWITQFQSQSNNKALSLQIESNGRINVLGLSYGPGESEYVLLKYDNSGNEIWTAVLDEAYTHMSIVGYNWDINADMVVDDYGSVYLTGEVYSPPEHSQIVTAKYNEEGELLWSVTHDAPGSLHNSPVGIGVDELGNVYVAGFSIWGEYLLWGYTYWSSTSISKLFLVKYLQPNYPVSIDQKIAPLNTALISIYPNPFNPTTTISYDLPKQSSVNLTVFDIQGRKIVELHDADKPPGNYEVQWNGMDLGGNQVSTGVYFCRLEAGDYSQTIKMVYLR
jgi:uncharacterized delta-60 repeat protein